MLAFLFNCRLWATLLWSFRCISRQINSQSLHNVDIKNLSFDQNKWKLIRYGIYYVWIKRWKNCFWRQRKVVCYSSASQSQNFSWTLIWCKFKLFYKRLGKKNLPATMKLSKQILPSPCHLLSIPWLKSSQVKCAMHFTELLGSHTGRFVIALLIKRRDIHKSIAMS